MKSQEKRMQRLREVLARLGREEIVQNRNLKTLLGAEHYARYCDDYCEQEQLRLGRCRWPHCPRNIV